jgi:hypothetical protein
MGKPYSRARKISPGISHVNVELKIDVSDISSEILKN